MRVNYLLGTIVLFFYSFSSFGLAAGDIMFIAFDADTEDGFAILALVDIPANSTIYFNDNEWNGSAIGAGGAFDGNGESEAGWSSGASILSAGTVITFQNTQTSGSISVNHGSISRGISLAQGNEVLYAFEGTDRETPTVFLSAISNDGFGVNGTLDNTGLTAGVNAVAITGDEDVMIYTGSATCNSTVADCAANIANAANWDTEDGGADESDDGVGIDFPASVPSSFTGGALPIELSSFKGEYHDSSVSVHWETASEINNDYFELRRSVDGVDFESVMTVLGQGTSTETNRYNFEDDNVSNAAKGYYYELVQFDFDGKSEAFPMIYVKTGTKSILNIIAYPNPVSNGLIHINASEEFDYVVLMDGLGKQIKEFNTDTLSSSKELDVSDVVRGNYLLKINFINNTKIVRVVIN